MNTLEDRITESLNKHADEIGTSHRSADMVLARSTHATTKHRRLRVVVASMATCSLLGTGVAVWKVSDRRPVRAEKSAAAAKVYPLRLKPTWFPNQDQTARLVGPTLAAPSGRPGPGYSALWTSKSGAVLGSTFLMPTYVDVKGESRETAIEKFRVRKTESLDFMTQFESQNRAVSINLQKFGEVTDDEMISIAQSIVLSGDGGISAGETTGQFALRFALRDAEVNGPNQWFWDAGSISVSAFVPTEWSTLIRQEVDRFGLKADSTPVAVRGETGELRAPTKAQSREGVSVTWKEHGWNLTVWAPDKETAIRFAEGLQPVDATAWQTLLSENPASPFIGVRSRKEREGLVNDRGALTVEFSDQQTAQIGLTTGEIVTEKNCLNATFSIEGRKVEQCIGFNKNPLMWTTVETVGDRKVLIAAVNDPVDVVVPVAADSPSVTGPISSLTVNDFGVDTMSIDIDEFGSFQRIGIVIVPLDDSVSALDLFKAEAPAPNDGTDNGSTAWPESVPVDGVQTDDGGEEFDSTLTLVSRVSIKR